MGWAYPPAAITRMTPLRRRPAPALSHAVVPLATPRSWTPARIPRTIDRTCTRGAKCRSMHGTSYHMGATRLAILKAFLIFHSECLLLLRWGYLKRKCMVGYVQTGMLVRLAHNDDNACGCSGKMKGARYGSPLLTKRKSCSLCMWVKGKCERPVPAPSLENHCPFPFLLGILLPFFASAPLPV